jgi:D-psicose/D-tagatose/L-ribulose 3-epimerase
VRLGASTFIWESPFRDEVVVPLAARAVGMGFDVLEICIEDPSLVTADAVKAACETAGIGVSVCGAFGPDRDVSHESADVRAGAVAYLRGCIDLAAEVGSPHVAGPMYSATGKARLLPPKQREAQRKLAAEGLRAAADHASERGVRLAIEPLNRFETDLVNTVEQGLELCDRIDRDNVGLLLDTFHMNIEEKDTAGAIEQAGDRLFHFHACENDRGTPGAGGVGWDGVFRALGAIGYDRMLVIEAFTPEIEEIARAVSTWRPVAASPDDLARDGIAFLRGRLAA